jgi:hypothetical protein
MRLKMANKPHHGEGEHGRQSRKGNPGGGTHLPQRVNTGGLMGPDRDIGKHSGRAAKGNSSILPKGAQGNAKGLAPTALSTKPGVRGSPDSHLGTAGRGGTGRIGKHDAYKGKPTKYSEDISHSAFERLGAE